MNSSLVYLVGCNVFVLREGTVLSPFLELHSLIAVRDIILSSNHFRQRIHTRTQAYTKSQPKIKNSHIAKPKQHMLHMLLGLVCVLVLILVGFIYACVRVWM